MIIVSKTLVGKTFFAWRHPCPKKITTRQHKSHFFIKPTKPRHRSTWSLLSHLHRTWKQNQR